MIQLYIQEQFHISYSLSGISRLMHRIGLKKLRPRSQPGKSPCLEKQVSFVLHYFQIQDFACQDAGMIQLFGDGMHLHHQCVPSLCWGDPKDPPVLPTNSNRKRLNILGAYAPAEGHFLHCTSEENCDAQRAIEFLERILKDYPTHHSIILYLDNAPYFHAPSVQDWLREHPQMIIEPLPTYSPNLNLIERLWKLVKEKLVNNRYYEKYKTFRAKVFQTLNHLDDLQEELASLMTVRFQLIPQN